MHSSNSKRISWFGWSSRNVAMSQFAETLTCSHVEGCRRDIRYEISLSIHSSLPKRSCPAKYSVFSSVWRSMLEVLPLRVFVRSHFLGFSFTACPGRIHLFPSGELEFTRIGMDHRKRKREEINVPSRGAVIQS